MKSFTRSLANNLDLSRGVPSTLLGVFACFVILSERGIARRLWDGRRLYDLNRRSKDRLAGVDAGLSLALDDEVSGAFVGDDLKVVRTTGVKDIDGRRRPESEDNGPLNLSHGDVLGVVVPIIAEGIEFSLEFSGDGRDDGVVGVGEEVFGTSECKGLGTDEVVDLSPDSGSDGGCVGHCVVRRNKVGVFMREWKAEVGCRLRVFVWRSYDCNTEGVGTISGRGVLYNWWRTEVCVKRVMEIRHE
jgi:hypothetical protein